MKPVSRAEEVDVINGACTPGAAYTHAKQLGKQGSLEQQLQPRARLIARNDYQSELRLATILAISERDAKTAAAAKHSLNIEGEFKKPAEPHQQSTSCTSSDLGQFTPTCRAQGQRPVEGAAGSSNADAYEWQDIDLTEDGDDSELRAREQPGSILGVTQGATGQKKPQAVRGWLLRARAQPSAMLSVTQAAAAQYNMQPVQEKLVRARAQPAAMLSVPQAATGQKEMQAVHEKFYNHHLPTEGVEEMLSVFSEEDT